MDKNHLDENNFEPAGGGSSGALNYQSPYGTPSGGDVSQNPNHFAGSNKTVNHMNNQQDSGSVDQNPIRKEDDPTPEVEKLFTKKNTPNPDEVMAGLQYELGNMVKKDKAVAKRTVIANLRKDPQFYSRLGMMNIDDKKMKVTEIKNIFQNLAKAREKRVEPTSDAILEAMRDTIAKREARRLKPE